MMILAPFVSGKKGEHRDVLNSIRNEGFVRARIDGEIVLLDAEELPALEKTKRHTIEAVVDRLITGKTDASRLTDSVELALRHGHQEEQGTQRRQDDRLGFRQTQHEHSVPVPVHFLLAYGHGFRQCGQLSPASKRIIFYNYRGLLI